MKKILLLFALVACFATGMRAADNVTAKVSGTTLNIALTNETTYCAFQMDITLPDGVSAESVAAVENRLSQTGDGETIGDKKFIVAYNTLDGNVLRVIAYNLNNADIENAAGDILNITLDAAITDPTTVSVSNIMFVKSSDLTEDAIADVPEGTLLGDVNKDKTITANDLTACVDLILNISGDYDLNAADVNGDGIVNANDLTALVDLILK